MAQFLVIKRGGENVVAKALDAHFGPQTLLPSERMVSLAELKALPAFDKKKQDRIKAEIDELVSNLYGLTKAERVWMLSGRPSD